MSEREVHMGHVWSVLRQGLTRYRERLVAAYDSGSYEREAAVLDDVARHMTDEVEPIIEKMKRADASAAEERP